MHQQEKKEEGVIAQYIWENPLSHKPTTATLIQVLSQKTLQFHTQVYWQCLLNEYEDDSFKRVSCKMPPLVDIFLFQEF